ncbi:MAG: lipid-A-disaccharide synthase [Candidatus Omnitrophota bacterium]|nr:lipid-A-disaccharide synthase [Candidatus Omnitrophota bacterium]
MEQENIIIVCGEASGDMHAGNLAAALLKIDPTLAISGVGGQCLRGQGVTIWQDIKELGAFGLFDVLVKLPRFFALKKLILRKIEEKKPAAIILVDFSGFNLRLAKAINKKIPVIYYVSPQVWASRPGRIKSIARYVHKMVVLFKFEEEFYRSRGIDVTFVGHTLADLGCRLQDKKSFLDKMNLDAREKIFALLPGSRGQEIKYILPVMLKTASLLRKSFPDAQFIIAKSPHVDLKVYNKLMRRSKRDLKLRVIEDRTCDCLNACDLALITSGTATLEAAMMNKPFVVIYKMNLLNYLLYRPQVKIPHICIVNIIARRKVIPEFIQFNAKPRLIAREVSAILSDASRMERIKADLAETRSLLGEPGAGQRGARAILDFLNNK